MTNGTHDEICGFVGESALYRISISIASYHRLVLLSQEGLAGLPDWLDWGADTNIGYRLIATTDPSYFRKKDTPDATNAERDHKGFGEL